ncbi:O-antigen polymerase [Clostridium sp. JN-1]|uniref:O-antigen ligase family protein n=1 Tax=Clostridium sp. JN-1 TaxID=2483110 RepID=UPI0012370C53|nr:O-antigen polymerase [Clostridium sp. JN-1]
MIIIYSLFIFILLKLKTVGKSYVLNFYKYFILMLNIFVIINFYEIVSKKSIFYSFIISGAKHWQTCAFGTNNFRTFSIFIHPIVYGSFLVVLFWCNRYIINNKIKYILQINVIINLYYTKSRSAWIAIGITLFIYYLKAFFIKIKNNNIKFTYKKVITLILTCIVLIFILLIFSKDINNILNQIAERFITATKDSYNDASRLQRLGTIKIVNNYMFNNGISNLLFGNGCGSVKEFMMNHFVYITGFATTDNQYVSFFYEFGLIGVSLYIFIVVSSIVKFFKNNDILDISNLSILCFLSISVSMFFYESYGWIDVFIFLIITMSFSCIKDIKKVGE